MTPENVAGWIFCVLGSLGAGLFVLGIGLGLFSLAIGLALAVKGESR